MINCDVCGNEISIDKWGNGMCKKCHWIYNAKRLVKNGEKLKPTYEEFLKIVKGNLEPTFRYKNKTYVATTFEGYELCEQNSADQYQSYATIEEFGENAKVDGEFLKDVWEKVYNFKLGC